MTHIKIRKMIEVPNEYAGRKWSYDFEKIPVLFEEKSVNRRALSLLTKFSTVSKQWDLNLNSEWTVRVFYAAKMVLSASVMAQSLRYAIDTNLRAVISYLSYYTVMHSLRAMNFTNPHVAWNDGEILTMTHSKTINVACSELANYDRELSEQVKKSVIHLKAFRELISYRAPSSGDNFPAPDFDIYDYCRCFLEIAQLQSELLEASIKKNVTGSFELKEEFTQYVTDVEIDGIHFHDEEDWYRIGYLARKHPSPTNLRSIMSEGHVEDFFGSWCADNVEQGMFDPDDDWRILFDVP